MLDIFNSGDTSPADAILSLGADVLGIGTDPREWWVGEAVKAAFHAQAPKMKAAGFRFDQARSRLTAKDLSAGLPVGPCSACPMA